MRNPAKTKQEFIDELAEMRRLVPEPEAENRVRPSLRRRR